MHQIVDIYNAHLGFVLEYSKDCFLIYFSLEKTLKYVLKFLKFILNISGSKQLKCIKILT